MVKQLVLIGLLIAVGCGASTAPRTELVLVADTNIGNLDRVEFLVEGAGKPSQHAVARVSSTSRPPYSLGVLYTAGTFGPLTFTATGYVGTRVLVSRRARASFVKGQTLIVPLHLVETCVGVMCAGAEQTCTERGCQAIDLTMADLEPWNGRAPGLGGTSLDGGTAGMDGAMSMPEAGPAREGGAARDASTDAQVDGSSHRPDSGMATHDGGMSMRDSGTPADAGTPVDGGPMCLPNYGDCYANIAGCETNLLTSTANCMTCGHNCVGNRTCVGGVCTK